jgi:MbtH protein
MSQSEHEDTRSYRVVVNHEEQYSIWLSHRELPPGWTETGKSGARDECLAYIREVWVDMTPLSVRQQLDALRSEGINPSVSE